jgi:uncharacterized membrane protein
MVSPTRSRAQRQLWRCAMPPAWWWQVDRSRVRAAGEVLGASVLGLFEQVTLIRFAWFTWRQAAWRSGWVAGLLSGTVTFLVTEVDTFGT